MKRIILVCAAVATLVMTAGCKKEQRTVDLGVSTGQGAKTYIDNKNYPCWTSGDEVWVNGEIKEVTPGLNNPRGGTIYGVLENESGYVAFYPASMVLSYNETERNFNVTVPEVQYYETVTEGDNTYQKVVMPMMARTDNARATDLEFTNLCAMVNLTLTNSTGEEQQIMKVEAVSGRNSAMLSGSVGIVADIDGGIQIPNDVGGIRVNSNILYLRRADNTSMVTILDGKSDTFSIVLPVSWRNGNNRNPETEEITFIVYTDKGYQQTMSQSRVVMAQNTIYTFSMTLSKTNGFSNTTFAIFDNLSKERLNAFHSLINGGITDEWVDDVTGDQRTSHTPFVSVRFGTGSPDADGYFNFSPEGSTNNLVQGSYNRGEFMTDEGVVVPFYKIDKPDGTTMRFSPRSFYKLFQGLTTLQTIAFYDNASHIHTEDAVTMAYMFDGCTSLTAIENLNYINTSHVTDMSYMFRNCTHLARLDLSGFDMTNVTNTTDMCAGLGSAVEGGCTITCTHATQAKLQASSNFPTTGISWILTD